VSEGRRRRAASMRRIADASAIGLAFPIAILIGYFFGRFVDSALGTGPWATYVFSAFGIGAGFLNAIRMGLRIGSEEDRLTRGSGAGEQTGEGEGGSRRGDPR